jgi:hypothetical protein
LGTDLAVQAVKGSDPEISVMPQVMDGEPAFEIALLERGHGRDLEEDLGM